MYLVDSDVFIDGKNHHYGFDIAPGFWDWLVHAHQQGRVFTVQRCYEEVVDTGDELSQWMSTQPTGFALQVTGADGAPCNESLSGRRAWIDAKAWQPRGSTRVTTSW